MQERETIENDNPEPWELGVRARTLPFARFKTRSDGYEFWEHRFEGTNHRVYVHQLLAIAEGTPPEDLFTETNEVHHKNAVPWDNRPGNIEVKPRSEHTRDHHTPDAPWTDEETFRREYERHPPRVLAEKWGCSKRTVTNWRQKHGISPGHKTGRPEGS
jgi:hypothetical protein